MNNEIGLVPVYPVYFMKDKVYQSEDVGSVIMDPFKKFMEKSDTKSEDSNPFIRDYVVNNISGLCNTFMIRLLEQYINKDEIAYIIDFTDKFDMKEYLMNCGMKYNVNSYYSAMIFILNQFIQFYVMTKLVYKKEGVDIYKTLYKLAYNMEADNTDLDNQTKYVFCVSILQNALEFETKNIYECCYRMAVNTSTMLRGN